jgi:hypothetical protein
MARTPDGRSPFARFVPRPNIRIARSPRTDGAQSDVPSADLASRAPLDHQALFGILDGRTISALGHTWRVRVHGVWDQQGHRWIQLSLHGASQEPERVLTIGVSPTEGGDQILENLLAWMTSPPASTRAR